MDAQRFLVEFGHIANAPGGIAMLRELVLCLAMQGKLVPQIGSEPPAEGLFQKIEIEKEELIRSGALRPPKPLPSVDDNDASYVIPSKWIWVRFGEIALHNSGKTLDAVRNSGIPRDYITTSNLYWGRFDLQNVRKMLIREEELERCTARRSDLLICEGGEAGRAAVWESEYDVCFQNHVHRARFYGGTNPYFAYRFLEKLNATGEINQYRKGIGISNLSSKALSMIPFPLPPLAEQSRIVAKVDELMGLCEKLEAKQQQRRSIHNALRQSSLQAVASASSPHELRTTWARVADNFGRVIHTTEDVRTLRDVILNLAMRGMLLPTATANTATSDEEMLCLPEGWVWKTLGELSEYITSGSRAWKGYISTSGDAFIRSQDIKQDALIFENPVYVSLPEKAEGKRTLVREGDLLLTITGGNVGKCARVPPLNYDAYVSQHVALIRLHDSSLAEFVHFWMINSYGGRNFLFRYIYGDKPGLNLAQVGSVPIPIPLENARVQILESLRQYQRMCEQFAQQVDRKRQLAEAFAKTAVASITGIAVEQAEDEPVKAPKTELIALLRMLRTPDAKAQAPLATILARHHGELASRDLWQRFGGEIDAFYAQLKAEVAHGWIQEPAVAEMRERPREQETS